MISTNLKNMLVKLDPSPGFGVKIKNNYLKPPPRWSSFRTRPPYLHHNVFARLPPARRPAPPIATPRYRLWLGITSGWGWLLCNITCTFQHIAGWNITIFNRKYIFKGSIFHCYVRLPECNCFCPSFCFPWKSSQPNKVAGLWDDPRIQDSRSY